MRKFLNSVGVPRVAVGRGLYLRLRFTLLRLSEVTESAFLQNAAGIGASTSEAK